MSTILVPIDFSDETPEVIEYAAMLARRNRCGLVLMHVAPGGRESATGPAGRDEAGEVADKLERLERYLRDQSLQVSTAVRAGEPGREIVESAIGIKADCIIIGRHSHACGAEGGSPVTVFVEQNASCTVVTVP